MAVSAFSVTFVYWNACSVVSFLVNDAGDIVPAWEDVVEEEEQKPEEVVEKEEPEEAPLFEFED